MTMQQNPVRSTSSSQATHGLRLAHCTHPHGEGAAALGEGAAVAQELQVLLADVVLQVEGGGEVGLAALLWAQQHGLLQGVGAPVAPQGVPLLEVLLAHGARERRWRSETHKQGGETEEETVQGE